MSLNREKDEKNITFECFKCEHMQTLIREERNVLAAHTYRPTETERGQLLSVYFCKKLLLMSTNRVLASVCTF